MWWGSLAAATKTIHVPPFLVLKCIDYGSNALFIKKTRKKKTHAHTQAYTVSRVTESTKKATNVIHFTAIVLEGREKKTHNAQLHDPYKHGRYNKTNTK